LAAIVTIWYTGLLPSGNPLKKLVRAQQASERMIEARITGGFRWAPHHEPNRGDLSSRGLAVREAASDILKVSQRDPSPRMRHAAAIAMLLTGNVRDATAALEAGIIDSPQASSWSDLAAARYSLAVMTDAPSQLSGALAAADAALRVDANLAEARFNRALILERLGLRDQARDEWETYLRIDAGSDWSNEAREHERRLQPIPPFREVLNKNYERLTSDPSAARALAQRYPQEARLWGETEILGRWAKSEHDDDATTARKHLGLARVFGEELARSRGDQMLRALVAAIDRANDVQRKSLIDAHLTFRDGQTAYRNDQVALAEQLLTASAGAFERGDSPGALLARYLAANTAFSQGRIDDAHAKLQRLLETAPQQFPAHRAQVLWQIGGDDLARARWGPAIEELSESVAIFERLNEREYAANVRQILAMAYEQIGDRDAAWRHRMTTLVDMGARPSSRLEMMLSALGRTSATDRDWNAAASFFDLAVDLGRRYDDPLVAIETLTYRAMVRFRMGDRAAASADLANIHARLQHVAEPSYRRLLETNAKIVQAKLASSSQAAAALLTEAIDFHETEGRRMFLPMLFLERGRANLQSAKGDLAAADFEHGIAELESRRETLRPGEDRWGIFYDADDLFAEAITLSLQNHDVERAFAYAERARARALLDTLGVSRPAVTPSSIPDGTLLIEYVVQQKRTLIFTIGRDGIRVTEQPTADGALLSEIRTLTTTAIRSDRGGLGRAGASVRRLLIDPVADAVSGKEKLVLIPDPKMGAVPFAALIDQNGRFLIEDHALSVAPSAAVFAKLAKTRESPGDVHLLLVMGSGEGSPLSTEREARAVANLYSSVERMPASSATVESFLRSAKEADAIHFAGHSVASNEAAAGGYLQLGSGEKLGLRQIASTPLPRTRLVVLSGCSTASGNVRSTEGTISVARAFLAAGVPSVVATLWPIDDAQATAFFPIVHRYLSRGVSAAEAVRAAQIEAIHDSAAPPSLWAAVQVVGN
jgi:CHAT domain-containing protein